MRTPDGEGQSIAGHRVHQGSLRQQPPSLRELCSNVSRKWRLVNQFPNRCAVAAPALSQSDPHADLPADPSRVGRLAQVDRLAQPLFRPAKHLHFVREHVQAAGRWHDHKLDEPASCTEAVGPQPAYGVTGGPRAPLLLVEFHQVAHLVPSLTVFADEHEDRRRPGHTRCARRRAQSRPSNRLDSAQINRNRHVWHTDPAHRAALDPEVPLRILAIGQLDAVPRVGAMPVVRPGPEPVWLVKRDVLATRSAGPLRYGRDERYGQKQSHGCNAVHRSGPRFSLRWIVVSSEVDTDRFDQRLLRWYAD